MWVTSSAYTFHINVKVGSRLYEMCLTYFSQRTWSDNAGSAPAFNVLLKDMWIISPLHLCGTPKKDEHLARVLG